MKITLTFHTTHHWCDHLHLAYLKKAIAAVFGNTVSRFSFTLEEA